MISKNNVDFFWEEAVENVPVSTAVYDLESQSFVLVNKQFRDFFQVSQESLNEEGSAFFKKRFYNEDLQRIDAFFEDLFRDKEMQISEPYLIYWEGQVKEQFRIKYQYIKGNSNEPEKLILYLEKLTVEHDYRANDSEDMDAHFLREERNTSSVAEEHSQYADGALSKNKHLVRNPQDKANIIFPEYQIKNLVNESLVGIYLIQDNKFKYVNYRFADIFGYIPQEIINKIGPQDITHSADWPIVKSRIENRISGSSRSAHYCFRAVGKNGEERYVEVFGTRTQFDGEAAIVGSLLDVTEQKKSELFDKYQRGVLERIAKGEGLNRVFYAIVEMLEEVETGMRVAILPVDQQFQKFFRVCAPSMPKWYKNTVNNLKINTEKSLFTLSALNKQQIIVPDVRVEPLCDDFRESAVQSDVYGIWSLPVFSPENDLIAVISVFFSKTGFPSNENLKRVDVAKKLINMAIARFNYETALIESKKRLKNRFEHAPIGQLIIDLSGNIVKINKSFTKITGYSVSEIYNVNFFNLLSGQADDFKDQLSKLIKGYENEITLELAFEKKNHEYAYIIGTFSFEYNENRFPEYVVGQIIDISDKKEAEQELDREKELLQKIIDKIPVLITMYDKSGKIVLVNRAFEDTLGWQSEDLQHMDIMEKCYPDELYRNTVWEYMNENTSEWREYKIATKAGNLVDTIWSDFALKDGTSVGIGIDITRRKIAEQALKKNEEKYRLISENSRDLICLHKPNGKFIYLSQSSYELLGYYPEELVETHPFRLVHAHDKRHVIKELFQESVGGNKVREVAYRVRKKDGTYIWFETTSKPIQNEEGTIDQIQTTSRDITDRKKVEERLLNNNQELKKINHELDRFVYNASHNLRAPLASILGLIDISRIEQHPDSILQYLDLIEKNINRLDKTIHEINDYSKNARLKVQKTLIDWKKLIDATLNDLEYHESFDKISFYHEIRTASNFYSDENRLKNILINLFSNAFNYHNLSKDNAYIKVEVTEASADSILLTVEDNGMGIIPEEFDSIFEMFYRGTEKSSGSGLGLYIVKEIVEKLQGKIWVNAIPGQGSIFYIILPSL